MTTIANSTVPKLTRQDLVSPLDVRWCPSCGDYAILNSVQRALPELGIPKENLAFISGIGCSSRFPYYMNTYGMHSIHGRAPTVATGLKVANPELSVWVITGDGDSLSIGGNHLLHVLRRNVDLNILLLNNRIYGLTKGQYSPTSEQGKKTKTSPMGSIEQPINPLCIALAAEATFVARTYDTNPKHMIETFIRAAQHSGASFVEIFQNCVIFNNNAFEDISGRDVREDRLIMLEHGKPLVFGKDRDKGIRANGLKLEVVTIGENGVKESDLLVHDENADSTYAYLLTQLTYPDFPTPMGVFRQVNDKVSYDAQVEAQIESARESLGAPNLEDLLRGKDSWEVVDSSPEPTDPTGSTRDFVDDEMRLMKDQLRSESKRQKDPILTAFNTPITSIIEEYGSVHLITVRPEEKLNKVLPLFRKHTIGSIPVIENGELKGILTERDVLKKIVLKNALDRSTTPVSTVMSVRTPLQADTLKVADVFHHLSVGGFRHQPLSFSDGRIGLISIAGLLRFIYDQSQNA